MPHVYFPLTAKIYECQYSDYKWPRRNIFNHKSLSGLHLYNHYVAYNEKHATVTSILLDQDSELRVKLVESFNELVTNFKKRIEIYDNIKAIKLIEITPLDEVSKVIEDIVKCIIPVSLFGCQTNQYLFLKIVRKCLRVGRHGCIFRSAVLHRWRLQKIPYVTCLSADNDKRFVLTSLVEWVMTNFVQPLICSIFHISHCSPAVGLQYSYIYHHIWKIWTTKLITDMIREGHLVKIPEDECSEEFLSENFVGRLQFLPKRQMQSYRAVALASKYSVDILKPQRRSKIFRGVIVPPVDNNREEEISQAQKYLNKLARSQKFGKPASLYKVWCTFSESVKHKCLYGCTVDVKDAFGSVNIDSLVATLETLIHQQAQYPTATDLVLMAQIIHRLRNQVVSLYLPNKRDNSARDGPSFYYWRHGLMQGSQYSVILNEIYRAKFDEQHLSSLVDRDEPQSLLHRTCDDYLFVSTSEAAVEKFVDVMCKELTLKESPRSNRLVLQYCGKVIDLRYGCEIKPRRQSLTEGMGLSRNVWKMQAPITDRTRFVLNAVHVKTNGSFFSPVYMDTTYNSPPTIANNFASGIYTLGFRLEYVIREAFTDFQLSSVWAIIAKFVYMYSTYGVHQVDDLNARHDFRDITYEVLYFIFYLKRCYNYHRLIRLLLGCVICGRRRLNRKYFITMDGFFSDLTP